MAMERPREEGRSRLCRKAGRPSANRSKPSRLSHGLHAFLRRLRAHNRLPCDPPRGYASAARKAKRQKGSGHARRLAAAMRQDKPAAKPRLALTRSPGSDRTRRGAAFKVGALAARACRRQRQPLEDSRLSRRPLPPAPTAPIQASVMLTEALFPRPKRQ